MEKCSDISFRKGTFSFLRIKPSRILNGAAHVRQEADDERGRNKNKKIRDGLPENRQRHESSMKYTPKYTPTSMKYTPTHRNGTRFTATFTYIQPHPPTSTHIHLHKRDRVSSRTQHLDDPDIAAWSETSGEVALAALRSGVR